MNPTLHAQIQHRLVDDSWLDPAALPLVDAACEGATALATAIASLSANAADPTAPRDALGTPAPSPPGAYLTSLTVAGFRGIGPAQTLELPPGPGLTLLLGRNGSGKSSFAEALETLLTGGSRRWSDRPKDWQAGWKNLHTDGGSSIEATFAVEGGAPLVVRRSWQAGADLASAKATVRRGSEKLGDLNALGWAQALETFRPFLSYAELSALLDRPSELYDKLEGILGLDEVNAAVKRLSDERKARQDRKKAAKQAREGLLARLLAAGDDPRAQRCHAAIASSAWDLDAIEDTLLRDRGDDNDDAIKLLRALAQLTAPSVDAVGSAVADLRTAVAAQAELAGTSAESNARLADLLERALHHCAEDTGACPVCGAALATTWAADAQARLLDARALAKRVDEVRQRTERCLQALRSLIRPVPAALARVAEVGLPTDLLTAWQAWFQAPADPSALCSHAEERILEVSLQIGPLVEAAREKLATLESAWSPIALDLGGWVSQARVVQREATALAALEKAEKWLKDADASLRDDRFEPIAARAQEIWAALRQQSNVDLARVKLEGKGNRRRVALNVTVDGQEGVAVSVMSQGELNALALSLFLPRMTLPESPFHFVVIDDPVQAMDPHKVDGLARVLQEVARSRQVIVLTHDARLYEAVRRLGIEATAIDVHRRTGSVVQLEASLDPVDRHFRNAWQIVRHEEVIGRKMAGRTVPGFCRLALEAACIEAIRRRRLGRGDPHSDVEQAIEGAKGLQPLAALAIHDDMERTSEVYGYLRTSMGQRALDAFVAIKQGAHEGFAGSLEELVHDSKRLAQNLRSRA